MSSQRKRENFRKRRYTVGSENNNNNKRNRRDGDNNSDTRVFLLGGNVHDPLNLMNVWTGDGSNELPTPLSSPNKTPNNTMPLNLNDPLNLTGDDNVVNRCNQSTTLICHSHGRFKRNKRRRTSSENEVNQMSCSHLRNKFKEDIREVRKQTMNLNIQLQHQSQQPPPSSPPPPPSSSSSSIASTSTTHPVNSSSHNARNKNPSKNQHYHQKYNSNNTNNNNNNNSSSNNSNNISKPNRFNNQHPRRRLHFDRRNFNTENWVTNQSNTKKSKNEKFRYGNYNRYYGYRNPVNGDVTIKPDSRMEMMPKELFEGKDILDIGCNTGQLTLAIARDYAPRKIVGIDIDSELIEIAKKNLSQCTHEYVMTDYSFPKSLPILFGKILSIPSNRQLPNKYPNNVTFENANYILNNDDDLRFERPVYDCILCLSITKWIHLNWCDNGIKQMFRRVFLNLHPGGCFILEPQAFSSYYKKAKLVPDLLKNFQTIRFKPEHFNEYLLKDVGFKSCQLLGTPSHKSKGFQRPIYLYTKSS